MQLFSFICPALNYWYFCYWQHICCINCIAIFKKAFPSNKPLVSFLHSVLVYIMWLRGHRLFIWGLSLFVVRHGWIRLLQKNPTCFCCPGAEREMGGGRSLTEDCFRVAAALGRNCLNNTKIAAIHDAPPLPQSAPGSAEVGWRYCQ